jgi:hypothetical protein
MTASNPVLNRRLYRIGRTAMSIYDYILPDLDLRQEIGAFIHHEFPHGLASGR